MSERAGKDTKYSILIDTTRCVGCELCVDACKASNGLPADQPRRWKRAIDDLSSTRYSTFVRQADHRFIRKQCRHCLEPACASACIVGALRRTAEGAVIYDDSKCMGCRYCMVACPFDIPRYDWDKAVPYVRKCTMCYERMQAGEIDQPACVGACPHRAMAFGSRLGLLEEARRRMDAAPGRYYENRIFGESEIGGTAIMYVSDIDLGFLAWKPELGDTPLPERTWAALSKVPPIVLGMGGLMAATYWIIERRIKLQAAAAGGDSAAGAIPPASEESE
ncbi:MAG: Formate dehydrogenase, nitrate-inducible, iron-sulfur subunit [candidate division BRC1 bacterium ADurb.BinA364]|nr:MAG: Formate dehydrogenase, nitrate-inducible, iron-sulfur subunit [candidate division BRC1 bacterium ADurb.BinA364]